MFGQQCVVSSQQVAWGKGQQPLRRQRPKTDSVQQQVELAGQVVRASQMMDGAGPDAEAHAPVLLVRGEFLAHFGERGCAQVGRLVGLMLQELLQHRAAEKWRPASEHEKKRADQ